MDEERFDVVDARDRVIDVQTRREVHRLGLRHRSVSVFVTDSAGRLLIQRRSMTKDEYPGRWSPSASGHVASGETYDDTAPRELLEEVGIACALTWFHTEPASEATAMEFMALYTGASDAVPSPDPAEVTEVAWWDPEALAARMASHPDEFTPNFRTGFARWRAR